MNGKQKTCHDTDMDRTRRNLLKLAGPFALLLACPAYALDLFKILDPKGGSKDIQRAKNIFEGVGSIAASATDLDYKSEFAIGESLALEGFQRYGLPAKNQTVQKYVNTIGNAVVRNSMRSDIPYYFVVVENNIYNAFACPGGIIFVSSALLKSMNNEAELACVLAHEVAHVGHKHALQSIKRAKFFEGVGKISTANMQGEKGKKFQSMIGDLQSVLFDQGLDKDMEFEADLSGMEIAYQTGYNPEGFIRVLDMLKQKEKTAVKKGSWFSTHPPLSERIVKCNEVMGNYPDAASLAVVSKRFIEYRKLL
ncbi:MAG: M48 family metalloprotease [Pseudomonadota bacterium]